MTKKAMKKLAREIYECDLIHDDPATSVEEKSRAEARIMQLTKQIMAMKNGMDILLEVDVLIQELAQKKN